MATREICLISEVNPFEFLGPTVKYLRFSVITDFPSKSRKAKNQFMLNDPYLMLFALTEDFAQIAASGWTRSNTLAASKHAPAAADIFWRPIPTACASLNWDSMLISFLLVNPGTRTLPVPSGRRRDIYRHVAVTKTCPTGHEDISVERAILTPEIFLREYGPAQGDLSRAAANGSAATQGLGLRFPQGLRKTVTASGWVHETMQLPADLPQRSQKFSVATSSGFPLCVMRPPNGWIGGRKG
ncbi:hypothetical protein C8F04DRAFT_1186451 [Mycena alexandri]|uniref:Uncharacterized protein n=1 Tax=Mycena alexandri TaxID=1745969 RepID=A0AAD6SMQ8_9AGAR|nr:hypothetical protein C8F04DRAFT_1186451 [Mycena alexandri]